MAGERQPGSAKAKSTPYVCCLDGGSSTASRADSGSTPPTPNDLEGAYAFSRGLAAAAGAAAAPAAAAGPGRRPEGYTLYGHGRSEGGEHGGEEDSDCDSASTPDDLSGIYAFDAIALRAAAMSAASVQTAAEAAAVARPQQAEPQEEEGRTAGPAARAARLAPRGPGPAAAGARGRAA